MLKYSLFEHVFGLYSAFASDDELFFCDLHPPSFTKYLRQTLVYMLKNALRERSRFYFSGDFC